MRRAAITGWGYHVPDTVLTNRMVEGMANTGDDWIRARTGIAERRVAGPGETTASMCTLAAQHALNRAGLAAGDLDLVVCASTTPDHLVPATGCLVQQRLGAERAGAFDLNAACTGFLYGLVVGTQFIHAGQYGRVLVVAGETLSRFVNWKDRGTCVLFGDGAAAVVLEATDQDCGLLSSVLGSRGDGEHLLAIEAGGSARPATADTVAAGAHCITMRGNEVFKLAVRTMTQAAGAALARAQLSAADLRQVIPHQANVRILRAVQESLGLSQDKMFVNLDRYGNTAAASVPIALCEFADAQAVRPGDNLLLVAFGGGLTWAAAVVRWADVSLIRAGRDLVGRRQ
jgi:3-oxoacyl-[acyl-carrier-protein] synthase-3